MDKRHQPPTAEAAERERRDSDRRRNVGLLELRARREGIGDRRQGPAGAGRARRRLLSLWRRVRS